MDINPRAHLHADIRRSVRELCRDFDSAYWQKLDETAAYPDAFVAALTQAGWLSALIPEAYGGGELSLVEASVVLEEINRSGANSGACHAQMYIMGTLLRHGSDEQKQRYLPAIARGELRLQSFAVTEPTTGTDTTSTRTLAERDGDRYLITGQKVWISRMQHTDLMLLLARTTPAAECKKKTDGLSIFLVEVPQGAATADAAERSGLTIRPIRNLVHHETNEVFFDHFPVPATNLIGAEGQGMRYILDGMNAERILIAAECIGDGYWFIDKARRYATDRRVFNRPIGQNQGVQFPIARAYANVMAADLMRYEAAALFDNQKPCGAAANTAKLLAADASWEAANVCLQTHGGFGFAAEFDVERKFRETKLYQVAPISTNLILSYLAEHVLELPRSF
jgi:acyl-CoA dehydrogenase